MRVCGGVHTKVARRVAGPVKVAVRLLLAAMLVMWCAPAAALAAETSSSSSASAASDAAGSGSGTGAGADREPSASASASGTSGTSGAAEADEEAEKPAQPGKSDQPTQPETSTDAEQPGTPAQPATPDEPGASEGSTDPERYYVDALLLKWDKPDDDGMTHFVGDSPIVEDAYKTIHITEFGEEVQLNGWYLSTDGTGAAYQTADSSTRIGAFDLTWTSSDAAVATVDPSGLVTPRGKNGTVTITATVADANVYTGAAPSITVTVTFDGQEGKYVERVEILDDAGNAIGESWGGVTVYTDENTFHQLHARVTWRNAVTGETEEKVTGSGEDYDASAVGTTLTWGVSASNTFSINEDTGRLRAGAYAGNAYVTCTAVGGLGGKTVTDTANVQIDTGKYEYDPAESLTLKVVWEQRPDEVVKEATFTYEELLEKLQSTHVNATIGNGTRYGVISADGWLFKDVVALVSVADADVLQYRFATRDGYDNPVSYRYLFESGNRYYFPNYDIGSRAEGQIVAPVLAHRSALEWGRSEANPSATLDDGNRFRLVFGCLAEGDANTSFQIYYITGITIVLAGGPSAGTGDSPDPTGDDPTEDDPPENPGEDEPQPSGKPGVTPGSSVGPAAGGTSPDRGDRPVAGGKGASDASAPESVENASDGIGDAKRWRVYQMMNKTDSDVPDWDDENPLSPFALPLAVGAFAVGAGATTAGFRRRLR